MDGLIVYALLINKIKSAGTGIAEIKKENGYIVFVMSDGREFKVQDSTKDIIAVDIDEDNYIVVTYEDKTKTKSDKPIPYPSVMTGATEQTDGKSGLVPKPSSGDIRYLNSSGEWDDTPRTALEALSGKARELSEQIDTLNDTVPTEDIPEGSTLTSDGWAASTDKEVEDEFAKWMED